MKNSFDEKILEEAKDWLAAKQNVVLATVIQTWGSSPRPIGSRMIENDNGEFSLIDKEGKKHELNSKDMKLYKSGKEEVPNYFIEFLDGL